MRWYHPLPCDNTVDDPFVAGVANLKGFDEWDFVKGQQINDWNKNVSFKADKIEDDGNPDDVLQHLYLMIPVYSSRLQQALYQAIIQGIQFLPVKVFRPNDILIDGFAIANILNFIEAFDYDKSKYSRFSDDFPNPNVRGQITGITKYVLKKDKLQGLDIVRLKENKLSFFVSEKFKEIFEKNKFTGYSFKEVELS